MVDCEKFIHKLFSFCIKILLQVASLVGAVDCFPL
jgi:hypothetical protein